jgi:predicted aspartyl protease
VDTGCSNTSIRPHVAKRLGLPPFARRTISSPTDHGVEVDVYRVRLDVGSLVAIDDLTAVETPLVGQDIDGLLGRDVLRHGMLLYHGPDESWTVAF